ncbi:ornithine carbamoyltransferase [Euzebya tangerina]|uniref:ornithine carbamoyltransferase n=1 Tax=Euzebya tangerina TaxID=591198 RepID=UPI001F0C9B7C|nr:ornithine carbamoyltransferase [Euzebya tangerina]
MSQLLATDTPIRHFLSVDDLQPDELIALLDLADELKAERLSATGPGPLAGRSVALLFEKPSLRTRVSFEVGVAELGGTPIVLSGGEIGIGARESVADIARVLSGYVHAVVLRTFGHGRLEELAEAGSVPVVNALSDLTHPCQALADLQTIREYKGELRGLKLAYLGDGNNVAHSLLKAGAMSGMHVAVATPPGYEPDGQIVDEATELAAESGGRVSVTTEVGTALTDADVLYTDVWASMGQEDEAAERAAVFAPFQLNAAAVDAARPDAIVMHCLPAHREEEITAEVLESQASVVFTQAENRLHAQKALLCVLLTDRG